MNNDRDRELVAAVLAGNGECFTELLATYQTPIYNLALRMLGTPSDQADDLCQEIFTRSWLKLSYYDPSRPFFTWLYSLALNVIRNHLAQERRRPPISTGPQQESADSSPDFEAAASALYRREQHSLLLTALQQLLPEQREALLLRYYQDINFTDLATILAISPSAAKMRVSRGLANLRSIMARQKKM